MQSYIKFILILCSIMNINTKCSKGQYERLGKCKDCGIGTYSRDGKECEYCSPGTYAPRHPDNAPRRRGHHNAGPTARRC